MQAIRDRCDSSVDRSGMSNQQRTIENQMLLNELTEALCSGNRDFLQISKKIAKVLPFVIQPVEVCLKDVNYIARRKKAICLADTNQPTIGSMDVNLLFSPGEMTLVLGPPASGKTVLLRAIADDLPRDKNNELCGEVFIGGESTSSGAFQLRKNDLHIAQLTVKETLKFAFDSMEGGTHANAYARDKHELTAQQGELLEIIDNLDFRINLLLHMLNLCDVQDTRVGNEAIRGLSEGEKKRLTIGEMFTSMKSVFLMDSISSGLDSFTANQIIASLREFTHEFQRTIIVALLQPPPETYKQFDNLVVLGCGRVVYSGPRTSALAYFEGLGFKCPEHMDEADFLTEILGWDKSVQGKALKEAIITSPSLKTEWMQINKRKYAGTWIYHFKKCLKRDATVFKRDGGVFGGALFWQISKYDFNYVAWGIFFISLFLLMALIREIPQSFLRRGLLYKQSAQEFYPPTAYSLSGAAWQALKIIISTAIFLPICYFMIGFTPQVDKFLIFFFQICGLQLAISGIFQLSTVIAPHVILATAMCSALQVIFIIFSGFFMQREDLPSALAWIIYVNPLGYSLRGCIISEFLSSRYNVCAIEISPCPPGVGTIREISFDNFNISESNTNIWLWGALVFNYGTFFLLTILNGILLKFIRWDGTAQTPIMEEESHASSLEIVTQHHEEMAIHPPEGSLEVVSKEETQFSLSRASSTILDQSIPITLCFRNITYTVPNDSGGEDLKLLNNVSGFAQPGHMTAIMGTSGAGKTTLLDVLSDRKTGGTITGDILVNSYPKPDKETWSRMIGYVEQFDTHSPTVTVREAVQFSATLRLDRERWTTGIEDYIDFLINLLELDNICNHLIGSSSQGGISLEQRKRTNVAVELAADPAIIFLDEPTSGLDAHAASMVVKSLNSMGKLLNRVVICTIHQPSTMIFNQRGGEVVFFGEIGESSQLLIDYFTSELGCEPIKPYINPATWILDQLDRGADTNALSYIDSNLNKQNNETFGELCVEGHKHMPLFHGGYAIPMRSQFSCHISRATKQLWHSSQYQFIIIVICCIMALLCGWIVHGVDLEDTTNLRTIVSIVFFSIGVISNLSFQAALSFYFSERPAFYREQSSHMYHPLPWGFAYLLAELPYSIFLTFLYVLIFYSMAGLSTKLESIIQYYLGAFFLLNCYKALAFMVFIASQNLELAQAFGGAALTFYMLLAGFLLPPYLIPVYYYWIYCIDPIAYSLQYILITQFSNDKRIIQTMVGNDTTVSEATYEIFLNEGTIRTLSRAWISIVVLILIAGVFIIIFTYGALYIRYIKR